MEQISIAGGIILALNVLVSYNGLKDHDFLDKYSFRVDDILMHKDYKRLLTSGFLHVSWLHLLLNMSTFYFFAYGLELRLGVAQFLLIYFGSLIGGNLFSLFIHRQHGDYSAVGASGALCGIVFASIALFPGMELGMFGLPFYIPSWAYGLMYVLFSMYGIRSQRDNIGHEAHLGGGLIGMIIAIACLPHSIEQNYIPVLCILLPSAVFIFFIFTKPEFLLVDNLYKKNEFGYKLEDKYHEQKQLQEKELNDLLEKISRKGYQSLSKLEKEKLKQHSNNL